MNFKALFATATIAATGLVATPTEARTSYCYTVNNGATTICILSVVKHNNWPYTRQKLVKTSIDGRIYQEIVNCHERHRYNYEQNMAGIACFEFC